MSRSIRHAGVESDEVDHAYDVLIIGAGLAGSCLARQLRFTQPDLSIGVVEAKTSFDYWVGESTIEVFVDYAHRCLGLGPYLAKHHLIKQALRYYWDSEQRDLPIAQMSEFGVNGYHSQLSYQLDRAALDRDLVELNRAAGIDVHMDTRVVATRSAHARPAITIDRSEGHRVVTNRGTFACRWLVDAAGRSAPLARTLELGGPDPRHPIGGYWARFDGCNNIDDLGDATWRRRTANALRYLATNHFMYRGYWIWLIPLSDETVSIGVKYDRDVAPLSLKDSGELLDFLRTHRCMRDVLGDRPQARDFYGLRHVARCTERVYSTDRWFLSGMSGLFADAFLSTGCAFLAIANRLIGEMIATDRSGDEQRFERQAVGFEHYIKGLYNSIRTTNDHRLFGSYDVMAPFRRAGQLRYHNALIPAGMEDLETLVRSIDDGTGPANSEPSAFAVARKRLAVEFLELVETSGDYYASNEGLYLDGSVPEPLKKKYHLPRDLALEQSNDRAAYAGMFRTYAARACELKGVAFAEAGFERFFSPDWRSGQTLAECLNALAQPLGVAAAL